MRTGGNKGDEYEFAQSQCSEARACAEGRPLPWPQGSRWLLRLRCCPRQSRQVPCEAGRSSKPYRLSDELDSDDVASFCRNVDSARRTLIGQGRPASIFFHHPEAAFVTSGLCGGGANRQPKQLSGIEALRRM